MDDQLRGVLTRAREHYRTGEYDQAEKALSELAKARHPFADVYDMLGVIYHQRGRMEEAEGMFQEALRLNPNYTEAALNLAVTYNDQGKYDEAREIYDRVLSGGEKAPRTVDRLVKSKIANMHAEVAHAYQEAGMMGEALVEYEKALGLCPQFHDIRARHALVLRGMGKAAEAQAAFEQIKQENPRYLAVRLHLGLSYYTEGKKKAAEKEWRDVLAIDPNNHMARMYLQTLLRTS